MNEFASYENSNRLFELNIFPYRPFRVGDRVHHVTGIEGFIIRNPSIPHVMGDDGSEFRCDPRTLTRLYNMSEIWNYLVSIELYPCSDGTSFWLCTEDKDGSEYISCEIKNNTNLTDCLIELLILTNKNF